ncbi:MAG TPA: decaprenyl-phosphate phosphoribosyltransferase [Polyangia bacterium]|jgi:4-hydroxybenzoate polyprenyltransferase|nr:decaprenyl-phosphate phosphoribosyltransferase [Polyangia bacterium]
MLRLITLDNLCKLESLSAAPDSGVDSTTPAPPVSPPARAALLPSLIRAMRPKQWIKNLLLFAGFVFTLNDQWRPFSPEMWSALLRSLAAFSLFSLIASAVYLLNDVRDLEKDRRHPTKRNRPIASGALSPRVAIGVAIGLMPICLVAGFLLSPAFAAVATGYLGMQFAYILVLKEIVLLDVFVLAIGFVMRAVSGAVVIGAEISPWLYTVTLLGSLFLGLCKRRNELVLLEGQAVHHRKILEMYTPQLLDSLISIVASSTVMAYSLYTFTSPKLPHNNLMMVTIPFVIFGLFRYLFLAHTQNAGGQPEEVFLRDKPLLWNIALWIVSTGLILGLRR